MAMVAFDRLDRTFEQAPVNDELADDITDMLRRAGEDFQKMRPALIWIFKECYLTRSYSAEKLIEKRIKEADIQEITKVIGSSKAQIIHEHFHSES
jgi:hypothetical protein